MAIVILVQVLWCIVTNLLQIKMSGADPGFLKRGFKCIKVLDFALLSLTHFSKYAMKTK